MTAILLILAGAYVAYEMDVDVFPDLTAPTVTVITEAHGMSPQEVERLVTYKIESSLNGAADVRRIRSSSMAGISIVWIEFDWGTEIYRARQIVTEKLSSVTASLPETADMPILAPVTSIMGEIMLLGLSADSTDMMRVRTLADWVIRPALLSTDGVANVSVIGGDMKEYQIFLSPGKMAYYNITLKEVLDATAHLNQNASGGFLEQYGKQYLIQGRINVNDTVSIGRVFVKQSGEFPVTISDIAEVKIGAAPKVGDGSMNMEDAVIVTIMKQPGANTLDLTKRIDQVLADIQTTLPADVELNSQIFRQSDFISTSISNLQRVLLEGGFFVIIVLLVFLFNWRTTIISLLAIPLSFFAAILVLKIFGLTINTMSLGGMAIAVGAVVDDAVIDVENVYKRLRQNALLPLKERRGLIEVVYNASSEIRSSILNATLIIIVSFIPLFLLTGMEGKLLAPLGISFITALVASLIVAITVTPVLSSYLLKSESAGKRSKESKATIWINTKYHALLLRSLRYPKVLIGSAAVLLFISIFLILQMGRSFLPEFNEGSLVINAVTPPGTSLEVSNEIGDKVEAALLSLPEIEVTTRRTGRAELDEHAQGVNSAEIDAPLIDKGRSKEKIFEDIRNKVSSIPGANITIGQPIGHRIDHMLSGTRANIAIKIFGPDLNKLYRTGIDIQNQIRDIEGLADVNVEQQIEVPQVNIKPNMEMMGAYNISTDGFAELIEAGFGGKVVTQVYEEGRNYDLKIRYREEERNTIEQLKEVWIGNSGGKMMPLSYIADIRSETTPYSISRENVQRKIVVSANVSGRDLSGVVGDIRDRIDNNITLPEGYRLEFGGQFESEERASRLLLLASFLAIVIIFLLLLQEFRQYQLAGIVLLNLPLALIGGIFAVYFTSGILTIAGIIGFISLFGIATRNGILLVSRFQTLVMEGMPFREAVINGAIDRLNPILMTALTTGMALIPLALAADEAGNEIQSPMAVVILGGLVTSTILNMFIIPAVLFATEKRLKLKNK